MIIAKYIFDKSIYENFIPVFNDGYTNYTVTDTEDENLVTRTIESNSLPTLMRFGRTYVDGESATDNRTDSLLEVLDMNTSGLTSCNSMFRYNKNLTSINCEWNTSNVTNMDNMFYNCTNLISLDVSNWNTSKVTNMSGIFNNCQKLTSLDVSNFNTSEVTSMSGMFISCTSLTSIDVSNFNTSKVTTMSYMFSYCYKLTSLDVSNFDTNNVTNMDAMFYNCKAITSLDVSNFNTSNVTSMYAMFYNCKAIASLDVSNFNTSKVTRMNNMFDNCTNLTSLDLSNFNTSNATDFTNIFYLNNNLKYLKCNNVSTLNTLTQYLPAKTSDNQGKLICKSDITDLNITELNAKHWYLIDNSTLKSIARYKYDSSIYKNFIPKFNTEFVGYFIEDEVEGNIVTRTIESDDLPTQMQFGSSNGSYREKERKSLLEILYLNSNNLTTCGDMFAQCFNLTSINTNGWDTSNVTNMGTMFYCCNKLTSIDISSFNTSKVTSMNMMFYECNNLTSLDVSNFNTSKVTGMLGMFSNCNKLTSLDVSNFDTSKVNTMRTMFNNCQSLTSLDLSNFNTSNVTDMTAMFYGCIKLTSLDVSNFNTSKVTRMGYMFCYCYNLTSLDVSNFNTSNVNIMHYMFAYCQKLTSLDVSGFNTSKVTDMYAMFYDCRALTSLDVSNFNTSNVTDMTAMFYNCKNLTSIDVSNFNTSKVNTMESMFHNCNNLQEVKLGENFKISSECNTTDFVTNCNANFIVPKDKKTYWLDEPLRKGDEIRSIPHTNGDRTEIKRNMAQVTFDGSEDENWIKYTNWKNTYNTQLWYIESLQHTRHQYPLLCDSMLVDSRLPEELSLVGLTEDFEHVRTQTTPDNNSKTPRLYIWLNKSKASTIEELKQWLSQNPVTIVYQLINASYTKLSDEKMYLDTCKNCVIETDSNISVQNITFNYSKLETALPYQLKPTTTYRLTFNSDNDGIIHRLWIGDARHDNIPVVKGYNTYLYYTSALRNDYFYIDGQGFNISNVVITEGEEEYPNYFEQGLYSVGDSKNLFDKNINMYNNNDSAFESIAMTGLNRVRTQSFKIKSNKKYIISGVVHPIKVIAVRCYDMNKQYLGDNYAKLNPATGIFTLDNKVEYIHLLFKKADESNITIDEIKNLNIQLEEGTIATEYEPYGYKVEVKTTGKNLLKCDKEIIYNKSYNNSYLTFNPLTQIYTANGSYVGGHYILNQEATNTLKAGTTYTITVEILGGRCTENNAFSIGSYYKSSDESLNYWNITQTIGNSNWDNESPITFSSTEVCKEHSFFTFWINNRAVFENLQFRVQFEEGDTATAYEPYKEDIKTFYLDEPLRAIGDVKDRIIKKDGKWVVERNCKEVVLDADNVIKIETVSGDQWTEEADKVYYIWIEVNNLIKGHKLFDTIITDKILEIPFDKRFDSSTENHYRIPGMYPDNFIIRTPKTNLASQTIEEAKKYIANKNITVIYQLETTVYEELPQPSELNVYNDITHISSSPVLQPNMIVKNKGYSLQNISPNATYTINTDSTSSINASIGGGVVVSGLGNLNVATPSTFEDNELRLYGKGAKVKGIVVVDGSNTPTNGYFEGLQSAYEEHKSKNLLDPSKFVEGYINLGDHHAINPMIHGEKLSDWIEVTPGQIFTLHRENYELDTDNNYSDWQCAYFYKTKERTLDSYIARELSTTEVDTNQYANDLTFTIPNGCNWMIICARCLDQNKTLIQLEEGTVATEYEPYGKYKAEVKVTGKNLAEFTKEYTESNPIINKSCYEGVPLAYVEKGKTYTLSLKANVIKHNTNNLFFGVQYESGVYDIRKQDRVDVVIVDSGLRAVEFVATRDDLLYFLPSTNSDNSFWDIQLEEGTQATEYEPYYEDEATVYLNSPLLKGDRIECINGEFKHYHKMGKVVLDGSEDWKMGIVDSSETTNKHRYYIENVPNLKKEDKSSIIPNMYCDKLKVISADDTWLSKNGIAINYPTANIILIYEEEYSLSELNLFTNWLQQNPVTVVYELETPWEEKVSDNSNLLEISEVPIKHMSTNSIVPSIIYSRGFEEQVNILPDTKYIIKLKSNKQDTIEINLGGTVQTEIIYPTINNTIVITTPTILTDNKLTIYGTAKISNVMILEYEEYLEDMSYFQGMKSSFEDEKEVVDGQDRYKVNVKLIGSNKLDMVNHIVDSTSDGLFVKNGNTLSGGAYGVNIDKKPLSQILKPNATYTISYMATCNNISELPIMSTLVGFYLFGGNNNIIRLAMTRNWKIGESVTYTQTFTTPSDLNDYSLLVYTQGYFNENGNIEYGDFTFSNIQINEGSVLLDYEEYWEKEITTYLKSPLLEGDELLWRNGKLQHYHKMSKVVLNGSENWQTYGDALECGLYSHLTGREDVKLNQTKGICDKFPYGEYGGVRNKESVGIGGSPHIIFTQKIEDLEEWKQWLSENPTTIVYELAEPYYEEVDTTRLMLNNTARNIAVKILSTVPVDDTTVNYTFEAPTTTALNENEENIAMVSSSINDDVVPYLMDMDYRMITLQIENNVEPVDNGVSVMGFFRVQATPFDMLKRDILTHRLSKTEFIKRIKSYLTIGKITNAEYEELEGLINNEL